MKPAEVPAAASNAAGASGEGLIVLAGVIVAAAGWKKNGHLGEWWWRAVIGTMGLAILASMTNRTKAAPIVKGFAWITFLSSCIYAIPAFQTKPVGKTNGKDLSPVSKDAKLPGPGHQAAR